MESLPPENQKTQPFLGKVKNKNCIELLGKDKFMKSNYDKSEELCIFERPVISESGTDNYCLVELKIS